MTVLEVSLPLRTGCFIFCSLLPKDLTLVTDDPRIFALMTPYGERTRGRAGPWELSGFRRTWFF